MIRGIDHLVVACADPDAAAVDLESSIGLACTAGGRHAGAGTWNRIAWLADGSYLELIGLEDPERARRFPVGAAALRALDEHGGGLATVALLVDDLAATVAGLRADGLAVGPPQRGSRLRDDGEEVEWWTAVPDAPLGPTRPFLIEHASTGAEWSPEALARRTEQVHPIGSTVRLVRLDVACPEPAVAATELHEAVGLEAWAVADLAVVNVGRHLVRLVPRREMAVPAVIGLAAELRTPRIAELLGMRFEVQPVERQRSEAAGRSTSGTG